MDSRANSPLEVDFLIYRKETKVSRIYRVNFTRNCPSISVGNGSAKVYNAYEYCSMSDDCMVASGLLYASKLYNSANHFGAYIGGAHTSYASGNSLSA